MRQAEEKTQDLTKDLIKIRKYIQELEKENQKLKEELALYWLTKPREANSQDPCPEANIQMLYEKGFHICSLKFGNTRKEECLFCAALLNRAKEGN